MALIVAKFGGTSVASPERIKNVAKRLVGMRQRGDEVVAVVSAMGKTTDELMGLASAITTAPPARELDRLLSTGEQVSMTLLAMAIEALGYKSISFTGRQAGIETNGTHNKARIVKVHNERILDALDDGAIPVVAGFQGIDANGDITTLGRGGSDTTAVAIAWGINADVCEIYSDVDGVYTTDPRIAPRARKLDSICYDDMLELSSAGSGVLQSRAVEFARKWKVVIHSRSAFSEAEGTYVKEEYEMEEAVITGIASDTSEVKVTIRQVPDAPNVAARVFGALAAANVNLDMIIQNVSEAGFTDISFTDSRGRSAPRQGDHGAHRARDRRPRVHRRRGHREGVARGHGHEVVAGRRLAHVPDFGRQQHQHRGHLHLAHPPVHDRGRGPGSTGRPVPAHRLRARFRRRVRGNPAFRGGDRRQNEERTLNDLDEGNAGKPRGGCGRSDGCGGAGVFARAARRGFPGE